MNTRTRKPQVLTVRELIEGHYKIPPYQRAYAWGEAEITTFLKDIRDARETSKSESSSYYIGSLVLDSAPSDEGPFTVVDGQQRLTTLFIILALDSSAQITDKTLTFTARPGAQRDLETLRRHGSDAIDRLSTDGIRHAAALIKAAQDRGRLDSAENSERLDQAVFSDDDLEYLLDKVRILRTELPPNTDLNHYFEIMNTRGEQLEKHEILKARLLKKLKDRAVESIFSRIWDACSVLDTHIQSQFSANAGSKVKREEIFGEKLDEFLPENEMQLFQAMQEESATDDVSAPQTKSLATILKTRKQSAGEAVDDDSGSYQPIIDFPNLLLHVLKIWRREEHFWGAETTAQSQQTEVRLEDKYLLREFEQLGRNEVSAADEVREFAFLLLKTRFLMDRYVIRTQPGIAGDDIENWVINHARKDKSIQTVSTFSGDGECSDGRRVLMLQAMFQVSDPRRASKYFLFQILNWLHSQEKPESVGAETFANFLERSMTSRLKALKFKDIRNRGRAVPNFLFNALDYCLWRLGVCPRQTGTKDTLTTVDQEYLSKAARGFHFRYRTSVEHFYPVNPSENEGHRRLENIDHFGNLCIMSRSDNARRSNLMPAAKVEQFQSSPQSLKFQLMAAMTKQLKELDTLQIKQHDKEMLIVLELAVENLG